MDDLRRNVDMGTRVAPLGLRFWDVATRSLVGDGLQVSAFPDGHARLTVQATMNASGVWVFHHLPGLAAFERALGPTGTTPARVDDDFWASPTLGGDTRAFVVHVEDRLGRFLPVSLTVTAPVRGLFSFAVPGGTGLPAGPGGAIPLFSAPSRKAPPGMAVLRAELATKPASAGAPTPPLPFALLRASLGSTALAWGLADRDGRATLLFPYPAATTGVGTPPPLPSRTWSITLAAHFTPPPAGAPRPERAALAATLTQPVIPLWKRWGTAAIDQVALPAVTLRFGEELAVASDDGEGSLWAR